VHPLDLDYNEVETLLGCVDIHGGLDFAHERPADVSLRDALVRLSVSTSSYGS
jgi:hypothetical protein